MTVLSLSIQWQQAFVYYISLENVMENSKCIKCPWPYFRCTHSARSRFKKIITFVRENWNAALLSPSEPNEFPRTWQPACCLSRITYIIQLPMERGGPMSLCSNNALDVTRHVSLTRAEKSTRAISSSSLATGDRRKMLSASYQQESPAAALFAVRLYLPFALHCALLNISGTLNISYQISGNSNLSFAASHLVWFPRRAAVSSRTKPLYFWGWDERKVSLSLAEIGFIFRAYSAHREALCGGYCYYTPSPQSTAVHYSKARK